MIFQRSLQRFSGLAPGGPRRDLMRYDARNLNAPARLQSDGTLPGFKRRVRSCRRWQLCFLQLDLRGTLPLGMPLGFRDPRRIQVAPCLEVLSLRVLLRAAYQQRGVRANFVVVGGLLSDAASGVAYRAANHGLFRHRVYRAAFCLWRGQFGIWRGPFSSTGRARWRNSLCAQRLPAGG